MNVSIKAKIDLAVLEEVARKCPQILDNPPTIEIVGSLKDGNSVTFSSPDEICDYMKAIIKPAVQA